MTQTCQQPFQGCDSWPDVLGQTETADVLITEDSESAQMINHSKMILNSHLQLISMACTLRQLMLLPLA